MSRACSVAAEARQGSRGPTAQGGAPAGSAGHDNARVIAENVLRVAAFR
jgi:hypothetical protein